VVLFIFFDSLLMLTIGSLVPFGFCTWSFGVGLSIYVALQVAYQILLYRFVRTKMLMYRSVGYEY